MIPIAIEPGHVKAAVDHIRAHGIPKRRESTVFSLVWDGRLYPPKYVISIAAKIATGRELYPSEFSGGEEANSFLARLGFEIKKRRVDWTWDECFLAVWGYDQLDQFRDIVKVELYREIASLTDRSEKAVEQKIMNASDCDTRDRAEKPIATRANAQSKLREVFAWYWSDKVRNRLLFVEVKSRLDFLLDTDSDRTEDNTSQLVIEEGGEASPTSRRKRSRSLVDRGRTYFRSLTPDGRLACTACGIKTLLTAEGEIIQLHHSDPIYESSLTGRTLSLHEALAKLVPLCPTCHSLAHTSRPPLSVESIKTLLRELEQPEYVL